MKILKQSTAVVIPFGPFVDKTDGVTLETGLVSAIDHASTGIMLAKNGGTLAVRHATVTASTYDAHGCYKVTLDTTDTGTLGHLRVIYSDATTTLPVWDDFRVVPANVYDALVSGTDALDVSAIQFAGQTITCAGGVTVPAATLASTTNITAAAGCALAADQAVNVTKIAGAAVSTSTAQIGVNAVQAGGQTVTATKAVTTDVLTDGVKVSVGTGAGQINVSSGNVPATLGTGAIAAATFAAGAINAAAIADGAIDAATFAAGAIDAAAIATDAIDADALKADAATEIANALLKLDLSGVTGEAAYSVLNALRHIRNKWSVSGNTLTVYKEDGTTAAFTMTVTTNEAAVPITGVTPAA